MKLTTDNIFTEYQNIVTVDDLMIMLDIGRNTAYNLLRNGDIKSIKIGRVYKIPKQFVIDYLNSQNTQITA